MRETNVITARQFMILTLFFAIGSTILIAPSSLAAGAKQDAWIAVLFGMGVSFALVWLYSRIGKLDPALTLVELSERLLGKWIGRVVSIWFVLTMFEGTVTLLNFVGSFMNTQIMPQTPKISFHLLFILLAIMGLRLGIDTVARSAELLFPLFVVLFAVLLLLVIPQFKVENIQPLLEADSKSLLKSTLTYTSLASFTMIALMMLLPACFRHDKQAPKAFFYGSLWAGVVILLIVFVCIGVLGVVFTTHKVFPSYSLAKKISINDFLVRIEMLMATLWFITLYFKLILYFYAATLGLAQLLRLREYRVLTYPLGGIAVVLSSVIYPDAPFEKAYIDKSWLPYIATSGLILPLLLLGVSFFRKNVFTRAIENK
ncbi:MAG: GerAB/ArcD/ProY family transporter [Tumebacillaceae bacterium]